jgi:hypothetical protein
MVESAAMIEPNEHDQEAAMALALAFTRFITENELTIDFWSECDGEGCLSTVALPFLATARAEGQREAIGECAKYAAEVLPVDPGAVARLIAGRCRAIAEPAVGVSAQQMGKVEPETNPDL